MLVKMNIGLLTNKMKEVDPAKVIRAVVHAMEPTQIDTRCRYSNTEQTMVVTVINTLSAEEVEQGIWALCHVLQQDCIAFVTDEGDGNRGRLVGPNAAAWGEFDESLFIRY